VSVNEKKWLVMHMHVQLKLEELRGPPRVWLVLWATAADLLVPASEPTWKDGFMYMDIAAQGAVVIA
jgi:hypothetical protein